MRSVVVECSIDTCFLVNVLCGDMHNWISNIEQMVRMRNEDSE